MNALTPIKQRISPKIREAIRIKVAEDLPWDECARRAGLSEAGIHKARKRPAVQELEQAEKLAFIQKVDRNKAIRRARALEHAEYLMKHSSSDAVQARMVEFLAGETRQSPSVTVNVNQNAGSGYEFVRPGQVVEIIDAEVVTPDSQSEAQTDQDTEE